MLHTVEAKKPDSICLCPAMAEEADAEEKKQKEKYFKFGIESSKERDLY